MSSSFNLGFGSPDSGNDSNGSDSKTSVRTKPRLLWHNIIFMVSTPILAAILVPLYIGQNGFDLAWIPFFIVAYTISNMAITCGYHRYFSHRSYDAHPVIEMLYILFGAGAFQSSIMQWSADHRRHHREVDTDNDPYSINKGFWYAHIFWMFHEDQHPEAGRFPADLAKNKWIMWQHQYYVWIASFMGFIVPGLVAWAIGLGFWGGVIIGGLLRIVCSQHSTFLINSAAHYFGRQPYTDKHTARDSMIMAFLTFGEGYHNFHHSFQADYRNGTRWYHWDPTKWWIGALGYLGLATKLKRAHKDEIMKARLAMEERQLVSGGVCAEKVAQLKLQIVEAQKKLRLTKEAYIASKREQLAAKSHDFRVKLLEMKAEMKHTKIQLRTAYGQWRVLRRSLKRTSAAA